MFSNQIIEFIAAELKRMTVELSEGQFQVRLSETKRDLLVRLNIIICFQNETYLKFLPASDDTFTSHNQNAINPDNEKIQREDLKYSGKKKGVLFYIVKSFLSLFFSENISSFSRSSIINTYN